MRSNRTFARAGVPALVLLLALTSSAAAQEPIHATVRGGWTAALQRYLAPARAAARTSPAALRAALSTAGALSGAYKLPVVIVTFPNGGSINADVIVNRISGTPPGMASVRDYYHMMSGGRMDIAGERSPIIQVPLMLDSPSDYYVGDRKPNNVATHLDAFLRETLTKALPAFDWRAYDNDGPDGKPGTADDDGRVDGLIIVFATQDGACDGSKNNGRMWGHRWSATDVLGAPFSTGLKNAAGKTVVIDDYIAVPAFDCDGSTPAGNGTLVHEIGHLLGLPDLYINNGLGNTVGYWDLMAYGNWQSQFYPMGIGAPLRHLLGWIAVDTVVEKQAAVLPPINGTGGKAFLIEQDTTGFEYALLENRVRTPVADNAMPGEGMLLWHVDPLRLLTVVDSAFASGWVTPDPLRPGIALVQADGKRDLENAVNRGDAGDLWPGVTNARSWTDQVPAGSGAVSFETGKPLGFRLDNIVQSGSDIRLDITHGLTLVTPVALTATMAGQAMTGVAAILDDTLRVTFPTTVRRPIGSTLRVQVDTSATAGARTQFVGWADGPLTNPRDIALTSTALVSYEAHVRRQYQVLRIDDGSARGRGRLLAGTPESAVPAGTWLDAGSTVRLEATPAADSLQFLFWVGSAGIRSAKQTALLPPSYRWTLDGPVYVRPAFVSKRVASTPIDGLWLHPTTALDADLPLFVDALGNANGRVDVGDLVAGLRSGTLTKDGSTIRLTSPKP